MLPNLCGGANIRYCKVYAAGVGVRKLTLHEELVFQSLFFLFL